LSQSIGTDEAAAAKAALNLHKEIVGVTVFAVCGRLSGRGKFKRYGR